MAEDSPLKRIVPKPDTSRTTHIYDVGMLYYEDVEAIYEILSRVAKSHPLNDIRMRSYQSRLEHFHRMNQLQQEGMNCLPETMTAISLPEEPILEPIVSMVSDEFEIQSLRQLRKVPYDRLPKLRINISNPRIWVSGGKGSYYVSVDDATDPDAAFAFNQIVGILHRRRSLSLRVINAPFQFTMLAQLLITSLIPAILRWTNNTWIPAVLAVLDVSYIGISLVDFFVSAEA